MLPDLSDDKRMAQVGRLSVLFKARREAAQKVRDKVVPMLNSIEGGGDGWDVNGLVEMVEEIQALNRAIAEVKSNP
jgi:hypothetical protein